MLGIKSDCVVLTECGVLRSTMSTTCYIAIPKQECASEMLHCGQHGLLNMSKPHAYKQTQKHTSCGTWRSSTGWYAIGLHTVGLLALGHLAEVHAMAAHCLS